MTMSEQVGNSPGASTAPDATAELATPAFAVGHLPDTGIADEKELAQRLAMSFATLMIGVTLPSESDYPYEPFWIEMRPEERLTRETFCQLMGLETSPDMIWKHPRPRKIPPDAGYESQLEGALWNILVLTMRSLLGEVTEVLVRGENIVQVPYFLFGRLKTGALVGVRSTSIET
jgi:hypothetical protein